MKKKIILELTEDEFNELFYKGRHELEVTTLVKIMKLWQEGEIVDERQK